MAASEKLPFDILTDAPKLTIGPEKVAGGKPIGGDRQPVSVTNYDDAGKPMGTENVMQEMGQAADAEVAQKEAQVPPEAALDTTQANPPVPAELQDDVMNEMGAAALEQLPSEVTPPEVKLTVPELSAPELPTLDTPAPDMLSEMGKVAEAAVPAPPKPTPFQQRHGKQPQGNEFPFRMNPGTPSAQVMQEMGKAIEDARRAESPSTVADIPATEMERMTAGNEQEANLKRQFADYLQSGNRCWDTLIGVIRGLTDASVSHERDLNEMRGMLERSRL